MLLFGWGEWCCNSSWVTHAESHVGFVKIRSEGICFKCLPKISPDSLVLSMGSSRHRQQPVLELMAGFKWRWLCKVCDVVVLQILS